METIIKDIQRCIKEKDEHGLNKHEIQDFKRSYPKLYAMILDPNCDSNILNRCIKLSQQLKNGQIEKDNTDVKFGQILADKFLPKE